MKIKMILSTLTVFGLLTSCASLLGTSSKEYTLNSPPVIGEAPDVGKLYLGGFSGLDLIESSANSWTLVTLTDRGPNTNSYDFDGDEIKDRGFILPNFTPEILIVKVTTNGADIMRRIPLKDKQGKLIQGLPNQGKSRTSAKSFDEAPFNLKREKLKFSRNGLDPEGIAIDKDGNFWICEEYGPSILKVSNTGVILERFIPNIPGTKRFGKPNLPGSLGTRKLNRGFEGLTIFGNKLYTALQSPLPFGDWKKQNVTHIIEFDIAQNKTTGHYLYYMEEKGRKIGSLAKSPTGKVLILEQNGKLGHENFRKIYELNFSNATNILNKNYKPEMSRGQLAELKIEPVTKVEFMDLVGTGLQNHEKVEGMIMVSKDEMMITIDNDFGVGDLIDESNGKIKKIVIGKTTHFFKVKIK
jgi:3-phytase